MKTYSLKIYDIQFKCLQLLHAERSRIVDQEWISFEDSLRLGRIDSEIVGIVSAYLDDHNGEADQ